MPLSHEDNVRNGRKGNLKRLATTADWSEITRPAREGLLAKFERQVDPEGVLPPKQRAKMAEAARRLFYIELNQKSQAARKARKAGGQA